MEDKEVGMTTARQCPKCSKPIYHQGIPMADKSMMHKECFEKLSRIEVIIDAIDQFKPVLDKLKDR